MPIRTCIGCRRRAPRGELYRIAHTPGGLRLGIAEPGRGAWVCGIECFDLAVKRHSLGRALRCTPTTDDIERVRATLSG